MNLFTKNMELRSVMRGILLSGIFLFASRTTEVACRSTSGPGGPAQIFTSPGITRATAQQTQVFLDFFSQLTTRQTPPEQTQGGQVQSTAQGVTTAQRVTTALTTIATPGPGGPGQSTAEGVTIAPTDSGTQGPGGRGQSTPQGVTLAPTEAVTAGPGGPAQTVQQNVTLAPTTQAAGVTLAPTTQAADVRTTAPRTSTARPSTMAETIISPQELFSLPPTIEPQLGDSEQMHQTAEGQTVVIEELQFKCALNNAYPNWIYDISWYINDKLLSFHHTDLTAEQLHSAVLREKDWGETKKLGFNVKCRITARLKACALAYPIPTSANFFVGIQAYRSYVYVREGQPALAQFKSTVPIACWKLDGVRQKCYVEFEAFGSLPYSFCAPRSTTIVPERFSRFCGPTMVSDSWNSWFSMEIPLLYSKVTSYIYGVYEIRAIRHLPLPSTYRDVWEGVELLNNWAYFRSSYSYIYRGGCSSNNDPHMRTFDGISYENHVEGSYILYQHKIFPYSVQLLQKGCSEGRIKPACNYGVAIQSGSDIFVAIRTGNNYRSPMRVFKYGCFDSGIKVRAGTSYYSAYEITLPSGTKISLSQGLGSVRIIKSESDDEQVEGLCGNSDGDSTNDLRHRESTTISPSSFYSQPTDFILSWKVRDDEDLYRGILSANGTILAKAAERPPAQTANYCSCKVVGGPQPLVWRDLPFRDEFCTPYKPYVKCNTDSEDVSTLFEACSSKRAENVLDLEQDDPPETTFDPDTSPASTVYQGGWTETTARAHCTNAIEGHPVYEKCKDLPEVDVNLSIDMCIKDIQLTAGTEWVYLSLEAFKQQCQDIVTENTKYWNATDEGESMVELIANVLCPADCSGHGTCENGTCVCNFGYKGADCGIEKGVPPANLTIPKSGLCDTSSKPCRATRVYGASFLKSSDLMCKMQEVHVDSKGIFTTSESQTTDAIFVNEYEIVCYLPTSKPKGSSSASRPWLTGYKVSVSNDRVKFGDEALILPRDSTCFDCIANENGTTCELLDTHCYIDGSCYTNGVKDPSRDCYFCDTSISKLAWTFMEVDGVTCGVCGLTGSLKLTATMVLGTCAMIWRLFLN